MRNLRKQTGFTLIELLIVVAIIGIIAAIAIPNLLNAIDRGKQKRSMADMRSIGTAVESYSVDVNFYPISTSMATIDSDQGRLGRPVLLRLGYGRLGLGLHDLDVRQGQKGEQLERRRHVGLRLRHHLPERHVHGLSGRGPDLVGMRSPAGAAPRRPPAGAFLDAEAI
jgi:prepilin-type N-terminal cleavage/methylation domain-containing protein